MIFSKQTFEGLIYYFAFDIAAPNYKIFCTFLNEIKLLKVALLFAKNKNILNKSRKSRKKLTQHVFVTEKAYMHRIQAPVWRQAHNSMVNLIEIQIQYRKVNLKKSFNKEVINVTLMLTNRSWFKQKCTSYAWMLLHSFRVVN